MSLLKDKLKEIGKHGLDKVIEKINTDSRYSGQKEINNIEGKKEERAEEKKEERVDSRENIFNNTIDKINTDSRYNEQKEVNNKGEERENIFNKFISRGNKSRHIKKENKQIQKINNQNRDIERQEIEIYEKEKKIRLYEEDINIKQMLMEENLREQKIIKNKEIIENNEDILQKKSAILSRLKESSNSSFNFYKVKDNMEMGMSFVDALNTSGMVPNVMYNLDYNGNKICRIHNRNVDDICNNLKQNKVLAKLLNDKKAIMCIVGNPHITKFEIGILICDLSFGALLITRYKELDKYIFDVGKKLNKMGLDNCEEYNNIKLSKSFIKSAFISAIEIDIDTGRSSEEDMQMFDELCENMSDGANNIKFILKALS